MKNNQYKSFLIPITLLSIIPIFLLSSFFIYINISTLTSYIQEDISQLKQQYLKSKKEFALNEVEKTDKLIKTNKLKVEEKLKALLKERVLLAHTIANKIYNQNKNTLSKDKIKEKIIDHLKVITHKNGKVFYFISDYKKNIILSHPIPKFINKDMTNFKDKRGKRLVKLRNQAISNDGFGFYKVYFNKPNDLSKEYPKLNAAVLFKPLNMVIGMGEYLDEIENEVKKDILNTFRSQNKYMKKDEHIFIIRINNLKGGNDFATLLLNPLDKDKEGNKISENFTDAKGFKYAKEMLNQLKEDGQANMTYHIKENGQIKKKYAYFKLQEDWNWVIGSGFNFENLNNSINNKKELLQKEQEEYIYKVIFWSVILFLVVLVISLYVSFLINKTIKRYIVQKDEDNKKILKQERIISEQSKLASMGEMIGNISHQWRQPLSIISSSATGMSLQNKLNALSENELEKTCNTINENAQYLSKTIDDFTSFIKNDKTLVSFNLQENINSFLCLVEPSIKKHKITVITNINEELKIISYPNELVQCYMNIFNNAKDAFKGSSFNEKYVFIEVIEDKNNILISFKDNAGGIPKDILPRIFEPYFTTKHQYHGTGLGLSMTYNLVTEGLKGDIKVENLDFTYENKKYKGAQFTLILPKLI